MKCLKTKMINEQKILKMEAKSTNEENRKSQHSQRMQQHNDCSTTYQTIAIYDYLFIYGCIDAL